MLNSIFDLALTLAGIGHYCILMASFQVPHRLGWKEDLIKLTSFNRKLMWTYGVFTVFTIVSFGTLTLLLKEELLRGDRATLALAVFIGLFWFFRIVADCFYFDHNDWPKGRVFVIGHVMLTGLFTCLSGTYLGLVIWHYQNGHFIYIR